MTTVSELYALSQGSKCEGDQKCHWCGGACNSQRIHDDVGPIPFQRTTTTAKVLSSAYCCIGCWLWRLRSRTITFLPALNPDYPIKDRQTAKKHSWWITREGAWAIPQPFIPPNPERVYSLLLKPPNPFALLLRKDTDNQIQLGIVNNGSGVLADTPIQFTFDNVLHSYTVYELEQTLKTGEVTGKSAGTRILIETFGEWKLPEEPKKTTEKGGRPSQGGVDGKVTKQPIQPVKGTNRNR